MRGWSEGPDEGLVRKDEIGRGDQKVRDERSALKGIDLQLMHNRL